MLKLTRYRKTRIPNAVAIAAAFLLLISALADTNPPDNPAAGANSLAGSQGQTISQPDDLPQHSTQAGSKHARKFRVHLFLFRH